MSINPKYYYNLSGNITDGKKEYSLHHKEDKVGGLSIKSDLKENHIEYGTNSLLDLLNKFYEENQYLRQILDLGQTNAKSVVDVLNMQQEDIITISEENKELKQHIKNLERELYLVYMGSMFSTVKSFKGDVSKRYYYSEETDTLYDSANNYGQYDKILDKKEVCMLLNGYETLLDNSDLND